MTTDYKSYSRDKLIELIDKLHDELNASKEACASLAEQNKVIESHLGERFRQVVEQSQGVVWEVDASGLYTYVSPLSTSVYGYTPDQMIGNLHFYDLHPEEEREQFKKAAFAVFKRKESFKNLISVGITFAGEKRFVSTNGIPVLDASGNLTGYRGIDTDVTENIQAETELRKFRTIADQANYGTAIGSLDGTLIYVNRAFAQLHGYEIDELIGQPLTIAHTPAQLPHVLELVDQIIKKGGFSSEEVLHARKDGTEFPTIMSASLICDSNNVPQYISATIMDISELKEAEKLLRKSEEDLKFAQEIASMGNWEFNLETREIKCSANFYRVLGFKPYQIDFTYEYLLKTVHPDDLHIINSATEQLIRTGQPVSADLRFVLNDGSVKWLKTSIIPEVKNNQVTSFKGVSIDITVQKNNEEQIRELNVNLEEKIKLRTKQLADINYELQQKTEELGNFFNLSLDLLCIGDKNGVLHKVSNSWETLLGYPLEEIENNSFLKFVYPEDLDKTLKALKEMNENPESPHCFINRYVKKDGNYICIEWQTFPAGDYVYAAGRDVTEKIRASEFEKELLDLTPKLTGIPFSEINNAIDMSLKRIGSFLGADRSYIFELNPQKKTWSNTFEWCNDGIEPQKDYLQDYAFDESPAIAAKLMNLEDIVIPSVKDLPESWSAERAILEPQGIMSLVIIPLLNENNLIGFIGLDSVVKPRSFTKTEVNILRVLGNMLASLINHRHKEEIIEQTRKNYETFVNTIDDLLFVVDGSEKIIYHNETAGKRLGYISGELIGSNIFTVFPEDRREEARRTSNDTINGLTEGFSIPHITSTGTLIPVEVRLKRGFWNGEPVIFGVTKDISALTLSEEKFSKAFQSNAALMGISSYNTGRFLDVNAAFLENLEFTFEEVIGKTAAELNIYSGNNLRDQMNEEMENKGVVRDIEVEIQSKSGKKIMGLFSADLIYIRSELCWLTICIDITERKQAEEEIIRAKNEAEKANLAKSEFLSRMSHELRTPMNSILGFAQLLEMGELNAGQKKGVSHIINSGRHLLDLINEVLDISRIEAGKLSLSIEPVKVSRIISEVIDIVTPISKEKDLTITFNDIICESLYVKADNQRLKQVLLNLLNNAIKYNIPSGSVSVSVKCFKSSEETPAICRISVSDTGVGISTEDIHKIFIPFERIGPEISNVEGTGLGLAVVKKLMDAMNGKTGVESVKGQGSTFWIELPQDSSMDGEGVKTPESGQGGANSGKKGTILYIEDNPSNVELVEQILLNQRPDIRLITNPNGKLAVKLASEYLPGLILLDLNLPDTHGLDVLQNILSDNRTKSIPVVVISADAMPSQIQRLIYAGAKDYLAKPFHIPDFLRTIDKYLIVDQPAAGS